MPINPLKISVILLLAFAVLTGVAHGKVYQSREQALQKAFPEAESIETVNLYLSEEDVDRVVRLSGVEPESALYSFYVGKKGGTITGYAAIEAGTVRTLPETVIVVLNTDGSVRYVEVLAFFEPEEYKPSERWLAQFPGKRLSPQLRIGGQIQGISGATLSAQAITRQVRKSAALLRLHLEKTSR